MCNSPCVSYKACKMHTQPRPRYGLASACAAPYSTDMRIRSIASHLRPYVMLARRRTTVNHAFAAAVEPSDTYDETTVFEAMLVLGLALLAEGDEISARIRDAAVI